MYFSEKLAVILPRDNMSGREDISMDGYTETEQS